MKVPSFTKSYKHRRVLNFPEMELERGKVYAVLGANGSGKSTFAKYISGMIRDDNKNRFDRGALDLSFMPQHSYPFRMSVKRNFSLVCQDEDRCRSIMEDLGLTGLANAQAHTLSGGECQKLALGRVLAGDHDVIVLDEPTAAMDIASSLATEKMIRQYCQDHNAIVVLITHSVSQASRLADNVLFFHEGELVEICSAAQLQTGPVNEKTREFLKFYEI